MTDIPEAKHVTREIYVVKSEMYPMLHNDELYMYFTDTGLELWGFRVIDGEVLSYEACGFSSAVEAHTRYKEVIDRQGWW